MIKRDHDYEINIFQFLGSIALIYVALKHSKFLSWASGINEPWSSLMTVLIWVGTAIGYIEILLWIIIIIIVIIIVGAYIRKKVVNE